VTNPPIKIGSKNATTICFSSKLFGMKRKEFQRQRTLHNSEANTEMLDGHLDDNTIKTQQIKLQSSSRILRYRYRTRRDNQRYGFHRYVLVQDDSNAHPRTVKIRVWLLYNIVQQEPHLPTQPEMHGNTGYGTAGQISTNGLDHVFDCLTLK